VRRWTLIIDVSSPMTPTGWWSSLAGLIRLMDLGERTPMFDLRLRAQWRGKGIGGQALRWLTAYLFTELPAIARVEGNTRQDNRAMRRAFQRAGYVKETHYRDGWPLDGGEVYDGVGYAILRRDWLAGTTTAPEWHDEHMLTSAPSAAGLDAATDQ
jgi:RimJ/RimL family protein N-acetyltransferase